MSRVVSPLPAQGDLVQAHYERVDFYAPRGATKLILDRVRPTGEGELLRRRAETLRRLRADGLCDPDRRKPLLAFPRRVGVIAARNDANIDVIQALRRRFPPQDIVFCAASVQGVHAVGSVIDALGRLQAVEGVDVIVRRSRRRLDRRPAGVRRRASVPGDLRLRGAGHNEHRPHQGSSQLRPRRRRLRARPGEGGRACDPPLGRRAARGARSPPCGARTRASTVHGRWWSGWESCCRARARASRASAWI